MLDEHAQVFAKRANVPGDHKDVWFVMKPLLDEAKCRSHTASKIATRPQDIWRESKRDFMELIVNVPAMERCMATKKHLTSVEEDLMATAESKIGMKMFGPALKELTQ